MALIESLIAASWLTVAASSAAIAHDPVEGVWRAQVERSGDRDDVYLELRRDDDGPKAFISMPSIGMQNVLIGPYKATETGVNFPAIGFELEASGDGLDGTLPGAFVPLYAVHAHFERSQPPAAQEEPVYSGAAPSPLWTASLDQTVWAGLTYDRRTHFVYAASDEGFVHALKGGSGEEAWVTDLAAPIRATPILSKNRIYIVTDAAYHAINAQTGDVIWSTPAGEALAERLPVSDQNSRWDHYSAAVRLSGDTVVAAGRDGCVKALAQDTGDLRWSFCVEDVITGTPAIADGRVYFGGFDGLAYAVSLEDGHEIWRRDLGAPIPRGAAVAGGKVIFGTRAYDLFALDAMTGETKWRRYFWFSWIDSPPVAEKGVVYVGSSDSRSVTAFAADTGELLWRARVPGWAWPRLALTKKTIFAGAVGTSAYFAPRDGALVAIDRKSGDLLWRLSASPSDDGGFYGFASAPAAASNCLFAADLSGRVHALPLGDNVKCD